MRIWGCVVDFVQVLRPKQRYEECMELDRMLNEIRLMIPPYLQLGTPDEMKDDPPSRIMERYILQVTYHKAVCILHRRFWDIRPTENTTGTDFYSPNSCIRSSISLLEHQAAMHCASATGGCLEKMKWYQFSLINHDFLLAAMIVSLDLMSFLKGNGIDRPDLWISGLERLNAIKRSKDIWAEVIDKCRYARRAVVILTSVLEKLSSKVDSLSLLAPENSALLSASLRNSFVDSLSHNIHSTTQFEQWISPIQQDHTNNETFAEVGSLETFGSDLALPAEFNWVCYDAF